MINTYSKKNDSTKYISSHFKINEFKCNDGSDEIRIDTELVAILEMVRNAFKKPVVITSAYRTLAYNKQVGGASSSKHLDGMAADIIVNETTATQVFTYLCSVMPNWGGIILYKNKNFVHVDTRSTAYRGVVE